MYAVSTMFSTPQLEERFRRVVASREEIGGFLFMTYSCPDQLPYRQFMRQTQGAHVQWVHGWMIVPNEAERREVTWKAWDYPKARAIAEVTAKNWPIRYTQAIHFHTHPNGRNHPSEPDIAFWSKHCEDYRGHSIAAIATPAPLRIHCYDFDVPEWAGSGEIELEVQRGEFYSWREKRFAEWRAAAARAGQP